MPFYEIASFVFRKKYKQNSLHVNGSMQRAHSNIMSHNFCNKVKILVSFFAGILFFRFIFIFNLMQISSFSLLLLCCTCNGKDCVDKEK